jgi:hypothetical protein
MLRATTKFLQAPRATAIGDEVTVQHEWIVAAIGAPTYSATNTSQRTAVATGQIELIGDQELRNMFAIWRKESPTRPSSSRGWVISTAPRRKFCGC